MQSNVMMCLSSLFMSEFQVTGMGPQGLGRVHLGVCPQVYLHLLYLECNYIEHSRGYVGIKLELHGLKPLKLGNLKYKLFVLYSKG